MEEDAFARRFRDREGPYHLYDSGARPLIRAETGAHVLGALLDHRARLVFLDDPGCVEGSVLKITYPTAEWSAALSSPRPISFDVHAADGSVTATTVIKQTDFGMKPYSTLFGALKVIDEVEIRQLRAELGPAAIAKRLGIARSSVYRVLGT